MLDGKTENHSIVSIIDITYCNTIHLRESSTFLRKPLLIAHYFQRVGRCAGMAQHVRKARTHGQPAAM